MCAKVCSGARVRGMPSLARARLFPMKPILLAALLCSVTALVSAQSTVPATPPPLTLPADAPKLTAEQTAAIMKQLDALDGVIGKNRGDILGNALSRCGKAVAAGEAGALQLYLECYRIEHFERVNLKLTDYSDWVKRNMEKHKDPEFLMALWLQLDYLLISIQAQDVKEKDVPTLVSSLQSFIARVVTGIQGATKHTNTGAVKDVAKAGAVAGRRNQNFDSGNFQQMLRQSVKVSEFAKAFLLEDFLRREDWTYDPLDLKGIYENAILPYFLEKKPTEIPAQWDNRIKQELSIRAAVMSESEYSIFYKERYPEMLWRKAEYLVSHNLNTIAAMADMLKIIKENQTHASAGDWAKTLRQLVNGAQPPLVPTQVATPAAGGAPAASSN